MKRILVALLLTLPVSALAQWNNDNVLKLSIAPGRGTYVPLSSDYMRQSLYHVSSKHPVTVFFSTPQKVKNIRLSDGIKKLGPCAVVNVREADVWCDSGDDHMYIIDSQDKNGEPNEVAIKLRGLAAKNR